MEQEHHSTVRFSKEDIGGEILPILTRGLYSNLLDTLREYIQNAIDAKCKKIYLTINTDIISIEDDGTGMTGSVARKAIRLGMSDKNPVQNVGFRGIGIYSAFNICDLLEVFTKSEDDPNTYKINFRFKEIRKELSLEQERKSKGLPPTLYLEGLLERHISVERLENWIIESHGTKVIMSGILSEAYRHVNDWNYVVNYLQDVIPLPFSPNFKYGNMIEQKLEEKAYYSIPLTLQINDRKEDLYSPYNDTIFQFGGKIPPTFYDIKSSKESLAFAWVCINDDTETLKEGTPRGLVIKKSGFTIGNRRSLEPYFGRTVVSRRITGEIIIVNDSLIPNAARNDFENNSMRQEFYGTLPKFLAKLTNGLKESKATLKRKRFWANQNLPWRN